MKDFLVLMFFLFGPTINAQTYFDSKSSQFNISSIGIMSVEIEGWTGTLRISPSPFKNVVVTNRSINKTVSCNLKPIKKDMRIVIGSKDMARNRCSVVYDINLPKSVDITMKLNSAEIQISELSGMVSIELDSGKISGKNITGNLRVSLRKGDVIIDKSALFGRIQVVEKGNVTLNYSELPKSGMIDVSIKEGRLSVALPRGPVGAASDKEFSAVGFNISSFVESGEIAIKRIP